MGGSKSSKESKEQRYYSKKMGELADFQRVMAEEKHDFWRSDYLPYERAQIEANWSLMPKEIALKKTELDNSLRSNNLNLGMKMDERQKSSIMLDLMRKRAGAETELLPSQTALSKDEISARREILPLETILKKQQLSAQHQLTPLETELAKKQIETSGKRLGHLGDLSDILADRAKKGVDLNARVNEASADVAHSYKDANSNFVANSRRLGVGGMINGLKQNSLNKAKDLAFARTNARNQARSEEFQKTGTAISLLK